jgi:hypothetical protein
MANLLRVVNVDLRLWLSSTWIGASLPMIAAALVCLAGSASSETLSATVSGPFAAAPSGLRVLVRVDTRAAEKHVRVVDLMRNVQTIWKPYVAIVFADSSDPSAEGYDDEIQLVVSGRPGSSVSGASSLGWITFVAPGQPVSFMTVSVATASNLMAHSSWIGRRFEQLPLKLSQSFVTRAISWSAAHEIGHYVLRTSGHSRSGLMKGQLTAAEVMWNERGLVQLDPQDVEILRVRAAGAGPARQLLEAPSEEP